MHAHPNRHCGGVHKQTRPLNIIVLTSLCGFIPRGRGVPPWLPLNDAVQLLSEEDADAAGTDDRLRGFPDQPGERQPNSLVAAVRACRNGVARTHVINAGVPGALLVELYSRDGLGVMVSSTLCLCRRHCVLKNVSLRLPSCLCSFCAAKAW